MTRVANILDPIHPTLPEDVWDHADSPTPILKAAHKKWIIHHVTTVLEAHGYHQPHEWLSLVLTGSLTTYQYSEEGSDCDVSLFVDAEVFPEWSRAELIGIMVGNVDGTLLPGTKYPMQCFVVGKNISKHDLYKPGLRSGYDIEGDKWLEPPDPARSLNIEQQRNEAYMYALESADKMERLLRYEPDRAEDYWHQLHKARQRAQQEGRGDYSLPNIVYKFLANRGLFPEIASLTGEYIAKTASNPQAMLDANAGQNLQGLPGPVNVPGYGRLQFHSNGDIQRVANEYNQANGLGAHPTDYLKVNPQHSAAIAQEYERMPHTPNDPTTQAAYKALADETRAQYEHAVKNGYNFEFYPEHDPYPNSPREAVMDLHANKHMYVYPTEAGYGQEGEDPQDHPLLGDSGVRWAGKPVTHNDLFRAIHDFYGHAKEGIGFRADGEDNAYRQHAAMFSPLARRALTSETRGQNSWVNFGPHGEANQTALQGDTVYAQQKAGLMPQWTENSDLHRQARVAATLPDVIEAAYKTTLAHGGVTINLQGAQPTEGFAFSPFKDGETVVPQEQLTPQAIQQFVDTHQAALNQPNNYLGMWVEGGNVYIDVSQVWPDLDNALNAAREAHQLAIFDLKNFQTINVPVVAKVAAPTQMQDRQVAKFVYDPFENKMVLGPMGREEGENASHHQLLGMGSIPEDQALYGQVTNKGWVETFGRPLLGRFKKEMSEYHAGHKLKQALEHVLPEARWSNPPFSPSHNKWDLAKSPDLLLAGDMPVIQNDEQPFEDPLGFVIPTAPRGT